MRVLMKNNARTKELKRKGKQYQYAGKNNRNGAVLHAMHAAIRIDFKLYFFRCLNDLLLLLLLLIFNLKFWLKQNSAKL